MTPKIGNIIGNVTANASCAKGPITGAIKSNANPAIITPHAIKIMLMVPVKGATTLFIKPDIPSTPAAVLKVLKANTGISTIIFTKSKLKLSKIATIIKLIKAFFVAKVSIFKINWIAIKIKNKIINILANPTEKLQPPCITWLLRLNQLGLSINIPNKEPDTIKAKKS